MTDQFDTKTIEAFGKQWNVYQDNDGFYGSLKLFQDIFFPLLQPDEIKGCRVAEIGSGTGRIVSMLCEAGVAHVLATEPAYQAFRVLQNNVVNLKDRVTCLQVAGHQLKPNLNLDYIFSVGVIHHIPEPEPVMLASYKALKSGGKIAIWLYGKEGNRLYLFFIQPLRLLTRNMPHPILAVISWCLLWPLNFYCYLSSFLLLPLHKYMRQVIAPMTYSKRKLVIYDQLNPPCAKYYTQNEAYALVKDAGFQDIKIHHRHGYSWTILGTKL